MTFSEFKQKIAKIDKMELPGEHVQHEMAPIERILELKRKAKQQQTAKQAGVMVLFYPDKSNQTNFVLMLRKTYAGVHSAQVGFPGGKFEKEDSDLSATALRETEEEIGVSRKNITVLKKLTQIYIPPSNFFVQPYIGLLDHTPHFIPEPSEVEKLMEIQVKDFLDDSVKSVQTITTSYATNLEVPVYLLDNQVVWGATAMMLNEVRVLLKAL